MGVTPETWESLGSAYIHERGGGFIIALAAGILDNVTPVDPTVREWGAWWAYFTRKNLPIRGWMKAKGKATSHDGRNRSFMTVPARWPHEFDAEATLAEDLAAANRFESIFVPPTIRMADASQRAITAAASKRWSRPPAGSRQGFIPFPALWKAFPGGHDMLQGLPFDVYRRASAALAQDGPDQAKSILMGSASKHSPAPEAPGPEQPRMPDVPATPDMSPQFRRMLSMMKD